jgi:hypothetical protein
MTGGIAATANDAFRFLVQEQIVTDERIFGCPAGYNTIDNNSIGQAPSFGQALLPGENHWAMTGNQTDTTVGNMPIVFENPLAMAGPPVGMLMRPVRSNPAAPGPAEKSSLAAMMAVSRSKHSAGKGRRGPKMMAGGMDTFTQASQGQTQRVLNIVLGQGQGGGSYSDPNQHQGGLPPAPFGQPGGLPQGLPQGLPGGAPPAPLGQPGGLPPSPLGNP